MYRAALQMMRSASGIAKGGFFLMKKPHNGRGFAPEQLENRCRRLNRTRRALPLALGVIALASVSVLLTRDAFPGLFSARAHESLGAFPLAMIAFAYLLYQVARRPARPEVVKAILLAIAFLFWAANQLWPDFHQATLFNDIAIALFVLDVFLVLIGWPGSSPDESFAETYAGDPKGRHE
jgi:hypothetical protein